jgi:ABC-type multidrug transport system fused ATPase/permease subunit
MDVIKNQWEIGFCTCCTFIILFAIFLLINVLIAFICFLIACVGAFLLRFSEENLEARQRGKKIRSENIEVRRKKKEEKRKKRAQERLSN